MPRLICTFGALLILAFTRDAAAQAGPTAAHPPQTARAAGMALNDGSLPPGTLTARIVQGNFSGNLSGVPVTLDLLGEASKQTTTGPDGRAQFTHLRVGTTVLVWAEVNGERLQSESIVLPAESGVRVLLVAGDQFVDTTKPGEVATLPPLADAPPLPAGAAPAATASSAPVPTSTAAPDGVPAAPGNVGVTTLRIAIIGLTILAFAAVAYGQWKRRKDGRIS